MALPRILHHNIIAQAASVVASSTASGMAVANLSDGRPYTWWGPSAAPASIEIDAGVATEADYLYIPSHTLDSTLWDVSLYAADLPFSGMQLLTAPEDFTNAAWVKAGATVSANAAAAPDGTTEADKLVETTAAGSTHYASQSKSGLAAGQPVTFSIYMLAGERTMVGIQLASVGAFTTTRYAVFDLVAGSLISASGVFIRTEILDPDANGYRRIVVSATTDAAGAANVLVMLIDASGSNTYTGDGASGFYVWGALFNLGDNAAPYTPQTNGRWISEPALCYSNRIGDPQSAASMIYGTATVDENTAFAPGGSRTADTVTDSSASATQYRESLLTELHYAEAGHAGGIFIRKTAGDAKYAHVVIIRATGGSTEYHGIVIDTNTGAVSSVRGTPVAYDVEDAGDYWYAWVSAPPSLQGNSNVRLRFYPAFNQSGSTVESLAVTGSKIIWGAKLEKTLGRPAPYRADAPLFLPFTSTTKRYWLLRLNCKSGSALCAMSVCMIGKALTMPTGLPQGYDPVGRKVVGQRNRNERGQPLGTAVDYKWRRQTLRFQAVSWAWVRNVFARLWDNGLASEPAGFIWDYEAHVEDVQHVTLGEEFRTPHKSGQLCDLEFDVEGVVE